VPELPEVETICSDLLPTVVGRRISTVHTPDGATTDAIPFCLGRKVSGLRRRGKYLIADLGTYELIFHLGMSGRLFVTREVPLVPHVRVVVDLDDDQKIVFVDRRKFGRVRAVERGNYREFPALHRIGPEPLGAEFERAEFRKRMGSRGPTIKARLLNQRVVAGLRMLENSLEDGVLYRFRDHLDDHDLDEA
jgi:formamidopyrimidine-DNA glycosylase